MPQLPVILSAFAQNPNLAYLNELEAERDYLQEVFRKRRDLRHEILPNSNSEHFLSTIQEYCEELQVFHFGGHADGKHLFLTDQIGQSSGLAQILGTCPQLKLLIINGCDTQEQAKEYLAMGIPAVIATTCSVVDGQALEFAKVLHRALANHKTIENAFKQAIGAMKFKDQASTSLEDTIVVYRGLELTEPNTLPYWRLYIRADQVEHIKTWTFEDQERLPRLIKYYLDILKANKKPPLGVIYLHKTLTATNTATRYKDYLSEGVLPYYSLDAFHLDKGVQEDFFSEIRIIENLLKNPDIRGGFISGKGGVGKTRLMLQLGILAHEQKWNVVVINDYFEDLSGLCEFLDASNSTRHLLLIDYIEECSWFSDTFIDEIRSHCYNTEDIRFLANCRNSYEHPSSSAFLSVRLDRHILRKEYEDWVVENIIGEFKAQLDEQARKRFFVKKPSFAVFLRYLQLRHPQKDLLEVGDFKDWLLKRFIRTVNPSRKSIKDFGAEIKWLLCFPLSRTEKESYLKDSSFLKGTLEALIKDGWIEESNQGGVNSWRIVQDTVMDELAVAYFESYSGLNSALLNSFEEALNLGKGKNWMWAIHRIRDTNLLQGKKEVFYEVFRKGLKNVNEGDFALAYELGHTALIDENQRFDLFTRFPLFFESLTRKVTFALPLSYAMNWYAKQKEEVPANLRVLTKQWLGQWGEGKVVATALMAKLLSTYVKLFGFDEVVKPLFEQFFRSKVVWEGSYALEAYLENGQPITKKLKKYLKHYLKEFAGQKELHFVITAWLNAGGDKNIIQGSMINYLNKNANEKETQFVFAAWLNTGGDKSIIQNRLVNYLNKIVNEKEAQFVLNAWLNAGGDKSIIQKSVVNYLDKNAEDRDARFVLNAWLNAGGDKSIIQKSLINYFNKNAEDKEARFVLNAWLNAGGDKSIILKSLIDYLNHNAKEKDAQFVFAAWLNTGGDKSIILKSLIDYLNRNAKEKDAQFVFAAWLNTGGDKSIILKNLINYLNHNAKEKEVSFVFQAWLNTGGDKFIILKSLIDYLNHNAKEKEVSFVFQAWLNTGGDKSIILKSLIDYLNHNAKEKEVSFVFQAWLNAGGDKSIILKSLIDYLNHNAEEKEVQFVLAAWLNAGGDKSIIKNCLVKYLNKNAEDKEAQFVLNAWLNASGDKNFIQNSLIKYLNKNAEDKEAQFVLNAWLNASGDKNFIQNSLVKYLNKNAEEKEARFVIQAWLKVKGEPIIIQEAFLKFLNKHSISIEGSYIMCSWLDFTGNTNAISNYVNNFLQHFNDERNASFVLSKWMLNKGDKTVIESHIRQYVLNHHKNRFAAYVLGSLLDPLYVEEDFISKILQYLFINHLHPEAGFIFNTWVVYDKPKHLIAEYLEKYLEINHTYASLYKFYHAALQKSEYRSIILPYVADWIKMNSKRLKAIPVFFTWVKEFQDTNSIKDVLNHLLEELRATDQLPQFYLALPPDGSPERDIINPYLQFWEKSFS